MPAASVSYAYDAAGRLASFADANGGISRYTYDDNDNMIIDPEAGWELARY